MMKNKCRSQQANENLSEREEINKWAKIHNKWKLFKPVLLLVLPLLLP